MRVKRGVMQLGFEALLQGREPCQVGARDRRGEADSATDAEASGDPKPEIPTDSTFAFFLGQFPSVFPG